MLWKTTQRTRTGNDTTPTSYTVVAKLSSGWYAKDYTTKTVVIGGTTDHKVVNFTGRPK